MNVLGYYEQTLRQREMQGMRGFGQEVVWGPPTSISTGPVVSSISFSADGNYAALGEQAADFVKSASTWKWAAILGIPLALVIGGIVAKKLL